MAKALGRRRRWRWTEARRARVIEGIAETGNVTAAAEAAGTSWKAVDRLRKRDPAFAKRWDEVLDDASVTLEFRLACQDGAAAGDPREESAAAAGAEAGRAKFDPDAALRFLKWRHEKKSGRARRRGNIPAPPSIEEVTERIVRRVRAIKRHRARGGGPPGSEGGGGAEVG